MARFAHATYSRAKFSARQKIDLANTMISQHISCSQLSKQLEICERSLQRYRKMFKQGKELHDSAGRPPALDDMALSELVAFNNSVIDGNIPPRAQVEAKMKALYIETWMRRYGNVIGQAEATKTPPEMSERTMYRLLRKLNRM